MTNTTHVTELYTQIKDLLREEQLLKAFDKMEKLAEAAGDWNLRLEYENLTSTYKRMLEYIQQNMEDPLRGKMFHQLIVKGLTLNDRMWRAVNIQTSSNLYFKNLRETVKKPKQESIYEAIVRVRKQVHSKTFSINSQEYILMEKELFNVIWTSDIWSPSDRENICILLNEIPESTACLIISAAMMSFFEMYDPQKYIFFFDAYEHPAVSVNQRAMTAIAMGCILHDNRTKDNEEIYLRVDNAKEDPQFAKDLFNIQMQILNCGETERINKFMNEEFLPEMMKNPLLKRDKIGLDSITSEDSYNPEWEKWIESKDIKNKMNIMNKLHATGADIHMASFANMKNFPFFRDISNWFLPFNNQHPVIAENVSEDTSYNFIRQLIEGSEFCDSDSYSLFLFLASLPEETRRMMTKQMPDISDSMQEQLNQLYEKHNNRTNIAKKYIQDIYRFYKLFSRKHEFTDIFDEITNLQYHETLESIVNDTTHIAEVALFLFTQKHYEEAEMMYSQLELMTQPTFEIAQKRGFCLQQTKIYEKAIRQYEKADIIKHDDLWTLTHLAQCYNAIGMTDKAIESYFRIEKMVPEDLNIQLQMGNCLAKNNLYEQAFKCFFKVHYLDEKNITIWRAIAWYSLMAEKNEQAKYFYDKIEEHKEFNEVDMLNLGHYHWVSKNYSKAIEYYTNSSRVAGKKNFCDMMENDSESLMMLGFQPADLHIIIDIVQQQIIE